MEPSDNGYQVIPSTPHKLANQLAAVDETVSIEASSGRAVLLDLSGDGAAAMKWAMELTTRSLTPINKADLKSISKLKALANVRALKPVTLLVFTSDVKVQSSTGALCLFAMLVGARVVVIGDRKGNTIMRSRAGVLLLETPRLALELLAGYLMLVPLSWFLTEALAISLMFRAVGRASRSKNNDSKLAQREHSNLLYVRATLGSAAEGGMPTHLAGFAAGAAQLGHRIIFLVSGTQPEGERNISVPPSRSFSATKALFELWNNLVFTAKSVRLVVAGALRSSEFDFIYQRYSRFNWTGVLLSAITGLPLALEFNGSEVWVSREWDPVGQLWLLKPFEQLNLRAADLIFVVSEVAHRNLMDAGVSPLQIIVNPNGVDPNRFRPECGGLEIRRALRIEDRIVVGFVGSFGPWHGAPVLAEAARMVAPTAHCHFLFVGDGDERPRTESIVRAAGVSATFTGRMSHEKVPAYLDACDVLVSPHVPPSDGSDFFGSPTKLFEYMAMAKAIVASRLGQIAEVIAHGEDGLLVEPGDASALARAIERLAQDEDLRSRLGTAARRTVVEQYTWRHNAERVFDAIRTFHTAVER